MYTYGWFEGFPGGASGKELAYQCWICRRYGFSLSVGKILWRRKWQPNSSILAWRIPWTEESGGLQFLGLQRVRHNWATNTRLDSVQFSSVQSLSCVQLFATPWTPACQASLSITNSWSLPKKIKSVAVSIFSPSICHEVMGPDIMIFIFFSFIYLF